MLWFWLGLIGLFVGSFGTLIGAAGGFIVVPVLLFLFPNESPAGITNITLTVAFFNAFSGSTAYARLRRIDYRSALLLSLGAIPGSVFGSIITLYLNRSVFQYIFGGLLVAVAVFLLLRPTQRFHSIGGIGGHFVRSITDSAGHTYSYAYNAFLGVLVSFAVAFFAGLCGLGGGIMHVPVLIQLLGFPVHLATATSHLMISLSTLSAIGARVASGNYAENVPYAVVLSAGAVAGAQLGARLSQKVSGTLIVRLLAVGLAVVAVRLLLAPL